MKNAILSVILILASAIPGAYLAWWSMKAVGLTSVLLAIASAALAMLLSTMIYAALTSAGRAAGLFPKP